MMRRVVVTGLGMVTPLGSGVETTWSRLLAGESGAVRVTDFEVSDLPSQIACRIPRGDGSGRHLQSRPRDGAEGAAQGRRLHHLRHGRGRRGARRFRLEAARPRRTAAPTGVLIGSGIGGIDGIVEAGHHAAREGPAAHLALLHSRPADQPRLRLRLDQARAEGAEPRGRHRLLDRRACDRRRRRG